MSALLPGLLAGAAAAALRHRPSPVARLTDLTLHRTAGGLRAAHRPRDSDPVPPATLSLRTARLGCGAGAGGLLLLGGPVGVLAAVALVLAGPPLLVRPEFAAGRSRASQREGEQLLGDLPLVLDLVAACLSAGAGLTAAVGAAAGAVPGPCGRRLAQVAAALAVGTPPAEAWALLADETPELAGLARALGRAGEGGSPVAAAVARLAAERRSDATARTVRAAKRAGVLAVAPLGACFLPAFVLLGVVPVVVGLLGPVVGSR